MQLEFWVHDEASKKTVVVRHQLRFSADYADFVSEMQLRHPFSTLSVAKTASRRCDRIESRERSRTNPACEPYSLGQ